MTTLLSPLYVVACSISNSAVPVEPVISYDPGRSIGSALSLDEELVPALPGLWYAMHLPRTRFDTLDQPLPMIREYLREKRSSSIALIPADLLADATAMRQLILGYEPVLIISPASDFDAAKARSKEVSFALPPARFEDLNQELLDSHWVELESRWRDDWPSELNVPGDPTAPILVDLAKATGSALPVILLKRLLGVQAPPSPKADIGANALELRNGRIYLDALAQLEDQGTSVEQAEAAMERLQPTVARRLRVPLTIALPGVSSRYAKLADRSSDSRRSGPSVGEPLKANFATAADQQYERQALSLLVGHRSAGDQSMGIVFTDPVPAEAFHALAELERHWVDGPVPHKEERLRARIDAALAPIWTPSVVGALRSASYVDAFTNFPIGIVRLPGATAPLAACVPIAYHPISPLTRALQLELNPSPNADFSNGFRVLLAECILPGDPVGVASRQSWKFLSEELPDEARHISVVMEETLTMASLRAAISRHRPDVLVISAHGFSAPDSNVAGIVVGEEETVGLDLGPMPPLVILSACHSAPRGGTVVAIADLLIRAGASAVVSTLVPVSVMHNATFMTRFFLYLSESVGKVENHRDVLAVWHRVQSNSVIMDIAYGNRHLMDWVHQRNGKSSPLEIFMNDRSQGRISADHLYRDAEQILLEIAEERGVRETVATWLRSPGYLPESMMYTIVGDPSAIRLAV